jgi:hypothetical protein
VFAIWGAAVAVGTVLLAGAYFFRFGLFWEAMRRARWIDLQVQAFGMMASYSHTLNTMLADCPALFLALPAALVAYFGWRRTRYFGNTAPLLVAGLLFVLAVASPDFVGRGFHLAALVFLLVFVGGVFADLVESAQGRLVAAGVASLIGAAGLWNLVELVRLR